MAQPLPTREMLDIRRKSPDQPPVGLYLRAGHRRLAAFGAHADHGLSLFCERRPGP